MQTVYKVARNPKSLGQTASYYLRSLRFQSTTVNSHSAGEVSSYEIKYAEKLRRIAQEKGLDIEELKRKVKEDQRKSLKSQVRKEDRSSLKVSSPASAPLLSASERQARKLAVRKDSSPVKPLSSILNVSRILSTPHTSEQISTLWTAYHLSRSGGTGRGYICASIPVALYKKMLGIAKDYSSFVVPLPRVADGQNAAHEFFFMQWGFHEPPPVPSPADSDPFQSSPISDAYTQPGQNPSTSTVLFTPLVEYKLKQSFATPYLVLTHYTDLAHSHGVVLLRGEITPSAASGGTDADARYLLSQEDSQLLAMTLQKFYLWSGEGKAAGMGAGEKLLRTFHERPSEFSWEELLKYGNLAT